MTTGVPLSASGRGTWTPGGPYGRPVAGNESPPALGRSACCCLESARGAGAQAEAHAGGGVGERCRVCAALWWVDVAHISGRRARPAPRGGDRVLRRELSTGRGWGYTTPRRSFCAPLFACVRELLAGAAGPDARVL